MSASLTLSQIRLRYDNGYLALDDIWAEFEGGSFTALVGPSGCGKSSLLRVMAGLLPVEFGRISAPPQEDIGFVFQDPTLMAWRSVYDNVALPLRIAGITPMDIAMRTEESLALVGLSNHFKALPRELSGGMRMRVSLARALAKRPPVLLMDEPFAALDELTRFKLDDDLRAIWQQQKTTIVFVTHSVTEAAYLAERAIIMQHGHITATVDIPQQRGNDDGSDDFRSHPVFHQACRDIGAALRQKGEVA